MNCIKCLDLVFSFLISNLAIPRKRKKRLTVFLCLDKRAVSPMDLHGFSVASLMQHIFVSLQSKNERNLSDNGEMA